MTKPTPRGAESGTHAQGGGPTAARPPNVIWVIADQLRSQALGYNGDENSRTPNLDNIAAGGIEFACATAGSPLCCPSRGSILTSRYPHEMVPGHEYPLPPTQPTVANVFREHGYRTAYFGKWHLDGFHTATGSGAFHRIPLDRRGGFATWAAYENNNAPFDCWVHGERDGESFQYRLPGYETDELTDLLLEYIRAGNNVSTPFFAILSVQPPHDPYLAPANVRSHYSAGAIALRANVPHVPAVQTRARRDLAGYYACIENLDANVGRLVAGLRSQGLYEHTLVFIFSDHGDMLGSHGQFRKSTAFAEAVNVPFLVTGGPAHRARAVAARRSVLLNHVDIAPTTLGFAGIAKPAWMLGRDLSAPEADAPDSAYLQIVVPTGHRDSVALPWRAVVTADGWKYAAFEGAPWLMFNRAEDPLEQVNVVHNPVYARERARLDSRLRQWMADLDDSFTPRTSA